MPVANTADRYGSPARALHWLTALLILTAFPLGVIANALPFGTEAELARKAQLFSVHKTLGIAAFAVALVRILWAITQPHPAALHPERRAETFLAALVHWSLYVAILAVPLTGWLHHSATEGFAPILWPFGQDLPLVPKSPAVAETFGAMHWLFTKVLAASILLHVAGALKHHLVDRDATLRRMWSGIAAGATGARAPRATLPAVLALVLWAAALGGALALARQHDAAPAPALAAAQSDWAVTEGTLGITVRQMGADVTGQFADWTAAIAFDPETGTGDVTVTVAVGSLTLGSVTRQALEADFFDAATYPTATFTGVIAPDGEGHTATGTLSLRGAEVPLVLPFSVAVDGDEARAEGRVTLDRRDFGMGTAFPDETSVGFGVEVVFSLSATRT